MHAYPKLSLTSYMYPFDWSHLISSWQINYLQKNILMDQRFLTWGVWWPRLSWWTYSVQSNKGTTHVCKSDDGEDPRYTKTPMAGDRAYLQWCSCLTLQILCAWATACLRGSYKIWLHDPRNDIDKEHNFDSIRIILVFEVIPRDEWELYVNYLGPLVVKHNNDGNFDLTLFRKSK